MDEEEEEESLIDDLASGPLPSILCRIDIHLSSLVRREPSSLSQQTSAHTESARL